ncbi:MAG: response regulator, partial [Bacteroidota bacterium]
RFVITMPLAKIPATPTISEAPPVAWRQEGPLVLIAEDEEEIRSYLRFCLADQYRLLEAADGDSAWQHCQQQLPDLVISDVWMPGHNGLELSQLIRNTATTNHIPLILLTAKSGEAARLEGLEAGANEYLTKPFNRQELLLRVQGLIKWQQQLQEKYRSGDFSIAAPSQPTDGFMLRLVEKIKAEIGNEKLSVQALAEAMHLSRVQLFRKIKSLTGQTPTLFIRQIRLQTARQLLRDKSRTVAEVAYEVGFKDPAYFSRVYSETFGHAPSQRF